MHYGSFMLGAGVGIAVTIAFSCKMTPKQHNSMEKTARKALKHMSDAMDDLAGTLGMG